ncbi:MAG: hypothetical protein KF866_00110 [Phycisphaeraceae bacterium]|nr:hypothetical protein [Phycisphaeraceae bacterium]
MSSPKHNNIPSIQLAERLGNRGIEIKGIEARTPDGRIWSIVPLPPNHGRRDDGSWGPIPGLKHDHNSGFRLFEMDERKGPEEHDSVDGDTWGIDDLLDYLEAVGQPRN